MRESWFTAERYAAQREDALRRFGGMLRRWRIRNGWTQYTPNEWAKEAGFAGMAPGNLSNLEQGKVSPSPGRIFLLADLNRRIALQDWSGVRSRQLLERLQTAKAIFTPDGQPWGPTEFWACSVGVLAPPKDLDEPEAEPVPSIDDQQAMELSKRWRDQLHALVLKHDLDPSEALTEVARHVPQQQRKRLRQVLGMAGRDYGAEELMASWDNGWLPEQALQAWIMQNLHTAQPQP